MTNILLETIISLAAGARSLPKLRGEKPVHPSTLWRWARYGINTPQGTIKLEVASLAGRKVTSRESLERFLQRVDAAKRPQPLAIIPAESMPTTQLPQHAKAKAELDKLGI